MQAKIQFRLSKRVIAETSAPAVPRAGEMVTLDGVRGRERYRVVEVNYQYTDTRARRADSFLPAPVLVDLEVAP